jgi:arabinosaccharide transport system permease protein
MAGLPLTSERAHAAATTARAARRRRFSPRLLLVNVTLALAGLLIAIPFIYMVSASFKPNSEIYALPIRIWPTHLDFANYRQLFANYPYARWFVNSCVVTACRVGLSLLLCSMGGFALAKYEFRGKRLVFFLVLFTMLLPIEVLIVPLFILMTNLGWTNNYLALIVPFAANAYGTFLMRQFMMGVPNEMLDAARIDGASEWTLYWRIALPLARSGLVVLGIILFTTTWNDFLWPLIVLSKGEMYTLPLGIASMNGPYNVNYGTILAGATLSTIPVVAIFLRLQRQFIGSLTIGAIKG